MWQEGFWEFLNFKHDCNFCSDYTVQEHFSSSCLTYLPTGFLREFQKFSQSWKNLINVTNSNLGTWSLLSRESKSKNNLFCFYVAIEKVRLDNEKRADELEDKFSKLKTYEPEISENLLNLCNK